MSYKIKLLPVTLSDLRKAKNSYKEIDEELALDFKIQVNKELEYIKENPNNYQKKYEDLRPSKIIRFPYCIFI